MGGGGGPLADYFSNSLPGSINSDTNAPPLRGNLAMFSRSHLNYFGIFSICCRLSAGPKQALQLLRSLGPERALPGAAGPAHIYFPQNTENHTRIGKYSQ